MPLVLRLSVEAHAIRCRSALTSKNALYDVERQIIPVLELQSTYSFYPVYVISQVLFQDFISPNDPATSEVNVYPDKMLDVTKSMSLDQSLSASHKSVSCSHDAHY